MKPPRFRLKDLMIALALAGAVLALTMVAIRRFLYVYELHFHDFYFSIG